MKRKQTRRLYGAIFVFFICCLLTVLITTTYVQNKSRMEYAEMEQLVLIKTNKINTVISKLLYKTQTLSALVIQNNGEVKDFERVAATIIDDPAIRNVIIAPNGVVSDVYPLEGNEAVIGLNYFSDQEGNKEAMAAQQSGQLVLGGPFHLVQGGQALVGRLPVYIDNDQEQHRFWGLVSVTLNYPQALDGAELEQLKNDGFAYEIWRINPDTNQKQVIANSKYQYNKNARYVERPIKLLNAEWYFRLSPIRNWYQFPETWIFTFTGLMVSILMAALVLHNYDLRRMKYELEVLTFHDPLTGILNRRGVFHRIEQLMAVPNSKFIVCYLDLDKFKHVNDTYGHSTGDKMLRQFTNILKQHQSKEQILARIGGDEFIIVFKDTDCVDIVHHFFQSIEHEWNSVIAVGADKKLDIYFSKGIAIYPKDAQAVDELINFADSAMYQEKMRKGQLGK